LSIILDPQSLYLSGPSTSNYRVICVVTASDIYVSSATATTTIRVQPLDSSNLAAQATSGIQNALTSSQPEVVSQVIGAVTNSINTVNCTVFLLNSPSLPFFLTQRHLMNQVPKRCASRNREECSTTPNTCGSCLNGLAYSSSQTAGSIIADITSSLLVVTSDLTATPIPFAFPAQIKSSENCKTYVSMVLLAFLGSVKTECAKMWARNVQAFVQVRNKHSISFGGMGWIALMLIVGDFSCVWLQGMECASSTMLMMRKWAFVLLLIRIVPRPACATRAFMALLAGLR
jgi:hypothetical protein